VYSRILLFECCEFAPEGRPAHAHLPGELLPAQTAGKKLLIEVFIRYLWFASNLLLGGSSCICRLVDPISSRSISLTVTTSAVLRMASRSAAFLSSRMFPGQGEGLESGYRLFGEQRLFQSSAFCSIAGQNA